MWGNHAPGCGTVRRMPRRRPGNLRRRCVAVPHDMAYDRSPGGTGTMCARSILVGSCLLAVCRGRTGTDARRTSLRNGVGRPHAGHATAADRFRAALGLDRVVRSGGRVLHAVARAVALGRSRRQAGLSRHGSATQGDLAATRAGGRRGSVRLHQSVGVRKQLGLGPRPDHAASGDPARAAERRRRRRWP